MPVRGHSLAVAVRIPCNGAMATIGNRGPSTPQNNSQSESFCCAQDDTRNQNENMTCKSTRRLAEAEENGPPAMAMDVPKFLVELKLPTGVPGFALLRMLRPDTLNVRL